LDLDDESENICGSDAFKIEFGERNKDEANEREDESEFFRLKGLKEEVCGNQVFIKRKSFL